ncbi:hypothetical protein BHE74_00039784 [Ensete ventricosum]|nr:hypothetical protein BHE74_00039784 [Ensete ventricosum]RZR98395.1 hypothetical protein BHM03_00027743 [Ensete ventricosum]
MKALVISIWGLCTTEGEVRLQVPMSPMEGLDHTKRGSATQKAKCQLERRWTRRSTTVPQRRIYQSRRKGCKCKATDSRVMGLAAPWYHRGGTFMESSIPYSHEGRALVVKGAEEVENAKANSKYQDRMEA